MPNLQKYIKQVGFIWIIKSNWYTIYILVAVLTILFIGTIYFTILLELYVKGVGSILSSMLYLLFLCRHKTKSINNSK